MSKWKKRKWLYQEKNWNRNFLVRKYKGICYICDKPFAAKKDITIDHFLPISKGGTFDVENLRLAHFKCNQMKAAMTPAEFLSYQQGISE